MIQGEEVDALLNSSLTAFSDSPTYLFNNSGPFTAIKFAIDWLATAFANNVFPHPGGPYNKIPAGALTPNYKNLSGSLIGNKIECSNSALKFSKAPISSQVIFGTTANPSLYADG